MITSIPLPSNPITITDGVDITGKASAEPVCYVYTVTGGSGWFNWFPGWNVKWVLSGQGTFNVGIWGPNPTVIGPPFGRMRAPKVGQADAGSVSCQGNFKDGKYYVLVSSGTSGPNGKYTLKLTKSAWQVFG